MAAVNFAALSVSFESFAHSVSTESDSVSLVIGLREVIFDTKKGLLVNGVST